jgi:hypothetical protein
MLEHSVVSQLMQYQWSLAYLRVSLAHFPQVRAHTDRLASQQQARIFPDIGGIVVSIQQQVMKIQGF